MFCANVQSFAWTSFDMLGIDPDILCHLLNVDLKAREKVQRHQRLGEEKEWATGEEISKLIMSNHIREIHYPEWLTNVVMVKNSNRKWRMQEDFIDLNNACPKDSYPLPNINALVHNTS